MRSVGFDNFTQKNDHIKKNWFFSRKRLIVSKKRHGVLPQTPKRFASNAKTFPFNVDVWILIKPSGGRVQGGWQDSCHPVPLVIQRFSFRWQEWQHFSCMYGMTQYLLFFYCINDFRHGRHVFRGENTFNLASPTLYIIRCKSSLMRPTFHWIR